MSGSGFGKLFHITTFGESHGVALGCVIDGCPAGLPLTEEDIQKYLDRRKPGQNAAQTSRKEADQVEILSGVFEGVTTGTPIAMITRNTSQRSGDYDALKDVFRPGHADFSFQAKYGIRDHRGGGRSSGRETIGRVMGGAVASKLLAEFGISVEAYTLSIGDVQIDREHMDMGQRLLTPTGMPDTEADKKAMALIEKCRKELDSVGGVVECRINGVPAGLGDPVFEKLDAMLSHAMMSIGAVKAVEIGDGVAVGRRFGSENIDAFRQADDSSYVNRHDSDGAASYVNHKDGEDSSCYVNRITTATNHAGGILGGISTGGEILLRAHFKPTPSIARPQDTVDKDGNNTVIEIHGRHDPVIVPRAVVVVECMAAVTIADALLAQAGCRVDSLHKIYGK